MKVNISKLIIIISIGVLIAVWFIYDLERIFSLRMIKDQQGVFAAFYDENTILTLSLFLLLYIFMAALSLPGATAMTVAAGALFGFFSGTLIVSIASTTGATLAFLFSRFIFRETIQKKFGEKLQAVNDGIAKEGALYLFTMRMVPVFPFFLINILMGLTQIKTSVFFVTSQIGMLPGTMVLVNAGTQLAKINAFEDIFSPVIIVSFALLGMFPLFAKKAVDYSKQKN